ncbi:MAG TPA: SNF2 helicase-associated domain-containing protein, partial [Roseiflexaceae bacterium]|nr:SNF2 helicase-associated domain-containing protein [Roseiflexaceae bacterium]
MIVLHGSWLPQMESVTGRFFLWGETAQPVAQAPRARGRARKSSAGVAAHAHPFAATVAELIAALPDPELRDEALESQLLARLPTVGGEPQPSRPFLRERIAEGSPVLGNWAIPALAFEPASAVALLASLPPPDDTTPGVDIGADLRFWGAAARFALELLAGQRFVPALIAEGQHVLARWRPLLDASDDRDRLEQLVVAMPPACRALARDSKELPCAPRALLLDFLGAAVDDVAGGAVEFGPYLRGARTAAQAWLTALERDPPIVDAPATFVEQYRAWAGVPALPTGNFRLCFRLDPPDTPYDDRLVLPPPGERNWMLRYFLQANDDPSLLVPAEAVWRERGSALKFLNRIFEQPQEQLLAGLGHAARIFPPIEASLRDARPEASALTVAEAYSFISEAALLLQGSGYGVLLPGLRGGLNVRARLAPKQDQPAPKGGVAGLNFQSIVQFDWEVALGDQPLEPAEFERLAALKVPLVQIRGQWVELRPDQLEQALAALRRRNAAGELSLAEALRIALAPETVAGLPVGEVVTDGWLGELLHELNNGVKLQSLPQPDGLAGTLRHYQQAGFAWMSFLG